MIPERSNEQDVFAQLKAVLRAQGTNGKQIDDLWRYYLGAKPHQQAKLLQRLRVVAAVVQDKHIGNRRIYLEPPPPELIGMGDYEIGKVIYPGTTPYPVRVYKEDLLQHVFGVGKAGSGKTTFILNILMQAQADDVPWLALDWKGSFRVMMRAAKGEDLLVLTLDTDVAPLRVNLLLPPQGVSTAAWVENIADTICSSHLLMDGARSKLISVFFRAIREHGDRTTLRDAFAILKADFAATESWRRRGQGWMESTERAFEQLTYGTFGDCINEREHPMLISDLLERKVVLELGGLGQAQGATISTFFLQATMLLRQKQRGRSADHEHWKQDLKQRCEALGYDVLVEHGIGERRHVDLYAKQGNRAVIIEVETGKSDVLTNIAKCRDQPATLVLFFTNIAAYRTHEQFIPHHIITLTPNTIDLLPGILNKQ